MPAFVRTYTDLDAAIDDIRCVLQRTSGSSSVAPPASVSDDVLEYTRMVLHEWLANLVQHASFAAADPWVEVHVEFSDRHVFCAITDNSCGFDLTRQLDLQEQAPSPFPERGMGLRIIRACTETVSYAPRDDGLQHFNCTIPIHSQPWMNTLF